MKQLETFEKWYNANKILLVSNKKKRTEKIDVNIRLAGLKGYDLNEGIPDGQGRKIKDGVNELVKADSSLQLPQDISDTSLNRYRQAVQHIIKDEIDTLLIAQREKNKINPYSEDRYSIRPLWENVWSNSNSLRKGIAVRYPQGRLSSKISKNETLGKLCGFTINRFSHKNDSVSVSLRMFTPDF